MTIAETTPEMADMLAGYRDGMDADNPDPSENRSHSYRHGFMNGREDGGHRPVIHTLAWKRERAENVQVADREARASSPPPSHGGRG